MRLEGLIRHGLGLPAQLYLRPDRFAPDIDALAPDGGRLTIWTALRAARDDQPTRSAVLGLLGAAAIALTWAIVICALLELTGAPVDWARALGGAGAGVALGIAGAMAFGVAIGAGGAIAGGIMGGIALGVVGGGGVGRAFAFGVTAGVVGGIANGVARAPAGGMAGGITAGAGVGIAIAVTVDLSFGIAFGLGVAVGGAVAGWRLALAPLDVAVAWWLDRRTGANVAVEKLWAQHPARWDPYGRFPLPGLTRLLTRLQIDCPALAREANRVVGSNPTRRRQAGEATLLAADRTVARAVTLAALAALADDLRPLLASALLSAGERAELELLAAAGDEVTAALESQSVINRVERLRAARRRLEAPSVGSVVIARHRVALTRLAGEAVQEAAREQREREPVPRVYHESGTPLDMATADTPTTFKGRHAVFERLEELLGAGHRSTVILHGPRRTGKTSLLKQLPRRLGPSVIPVFVDVQGDLGAAENATTLLEGLAGLIIDQARARGPETLPEVSIDALATEPYVAFARWLDELERALVANHVLLCLDEFEKLQEQIDGGRLDTRVLDMLRGIMQHRKRVTVLLTGVHGLAELPPVWAATLVSTTAIALGPLERADAALLVEQPVPDFPNVYAPAAVAAILDATACQPFLLQIYCSVLVDELNRRRWHAEDAPIGIEDVAHAADAAVDRAENYFLDMWGNAVPPCARDLVRRLARSESAVVRIDDTDDELVQAVLALERRHIVTRTPAGHRLTAPLFARYVRSSQSVRP